MNCLKEMFSSLQSLTSGLSTPPAAFSAPRGSLFTPEALLRVKGTSVGSVATPFLIGGTRFGISPTNSRKSVWKLSGTRALTVFVVLSTRSCSGSNSVSETFISAGS